MCQDLLMQDSVSRVAFNVQKGFIIETSKFKIKQNLN